MEDYDKYLEYLEYQKHYSNYTIDNYKEDIDAYFAYLNREGIDYLKIEYSDIRLYLMYLKEEKKEKASTIGRHLSALRSFYRYLASIGKVDSNLFLLISAPKKEKNLPNNENISDDDTNNSSLTNDNTAIDNNSNNSTDIEISE